MNKIDKTSRKVQPAPLRVSRVFPAPRETVFKAWSSADHVKRWFCPNGYSVPEATVEMRVGGRFEVCMRSPEGAGALDQGDVHRGRGAGAPDDRPSRDRPVRRRTAVQRRHAGQVHRRPMAARGWRWCRPIRSPTRRRLSRCSRARPKAGARRSTSSRRKSRAFREQRRPVGRSRRLPSRAHLRCDGGASVQGAVRRSRPRAAGSTDRKDGG